MAETNRHDTWQAAENYETYMGRWSRKLAPIFLDWFAAPPGLDWLEIGCGSGALAEAILANCAPNSLLALDLSPDFVAGARANLPDPRADFQLGDARALDLAAASRDAVVSGLVLNFIPDQVRALAEMKRVLRPGGRIGFYVWDYPARGVEFMAAFWQAAAALDPAAAKLAEHRRFPFCTRKGLIDLARQADLPPVEVRMIAITTPFQDFEDYWRPFTLGTGPAPGYCVSLGEEAREQLRQRLSDRLPRGIDGSILLKARAWAVKTVST